ncbi:hypothetical protein C7S13_2600 [Burkholderia cepacia]|nr:hypothetical protein [Burkholderia cepacia]MDW9243800.1 hypothetical protein [Burkholderia cepacia]
MGHARRTVVTGCGCVPFGGFLRGFRGPRFRLVFVGRQQAAELAGGVGKGMVSLGRNRVAWRAPLIASCVT